MSSILIISGPLISFGQGATAQSLGFDVAETVVNNFHNFKSSFAKVIFSTWTPVTSKESHILNKIILNCGPCLNIVTQNPPEFYDFGNRYKQFLSIFYPLLLLGSIDDSAKIVRFRGDIEYSSILLDFILSCDVNQSFWVSEIQPQLYYLGDFIYIGSYHSFYSFLSSSLQWRSIWLHPANVVDYTIKYYLSYNYFIRFLSKIPVLNHICVLISLFFPRTSTVCFKPIPTSFISESLWRGVRFSDALPMLFGSNPTHIRSTPINLSFSSLIKFYSSYYNMLFIKFLYPFLSSLVRCFLKRNPI